MKKTICALILIVTLNLMTIPIMISPSYAATLNYPRDGQIAKNTSGPLWNAWDDKEDAIPYFMTLANKYGGSYEGIGKSSGKNDWDIILFKFGNPNGGKIMIDSYLHGNEFYGYQVLKSMITWLVTSNDADAKRILQNNYVLVVPVASYRFARTNYNSPSWMTTNDGDGQDCGVNLNRNFGPGWSSSLSHSNSNSYSGTSANSEPETQALINAWNKYEPRIYWNLHQGAGPTTWCTATSTKAIQDANNVKRLLSSVQSRLGVSNGWSFSVSTRTGGGGLSKNGAASKGNAGFLTEVMKGWDSSSTKKASLESGSTFKQTKAMFIAMCLAIEEQTTQTPVQNSVVEEPEPNIVRTNLFTDGFESNGFRNWDSTITTYGETVTTATYAPSSGNYHARFSSSGSRGYEQAYMYKTINQDKIHVKCYIRFASGLSLPDNNDKFYLLRLRSNYESLATLGVVRESGDEKWILYTRDGTGWVSETSSAVSIQEDKWYSIELHWEKDSNNGMVEIYVDGQKIIDTYNLNTAYFGNANEINYGIISATNIQNQLIVYGDNFTY